MSKYTPFVSLTCAHNFFQNGIDLDVKISPSSATNQALKEIEVVVRSLENGLELNHSEQTIELLKSRETDIEYSFHLINPTYLFLKYTDLPWFEWHKQLLKFENVDLEVNDDGFFVLHKDEFAGENDVKDKDQAMEVGGDTFGLVTLKMDLLSLLQSDGFEKLQYSIQFNRRSVYWRYYFIGDNIPEKVKIEVANNEQNISFAEAVEASLSTGEIAHEIISSEPIDLQENYNFSCSLKMGSTNAIELPFPTIPAIEVNKEGKFFANLFVYV